MRGPLKEQIQNALNRALHDSLGGNTHAAYIHVGGRRRNRKKKNKKKKNSGVSGSAWSTLHFQADQPPARCRLDIQPKAGGASPQVTKAKKTCKELKARLSPPRSNVKDVLEPDDKPLIDSQDTDDSGQDLSDVTQGDQENRDPSKMPLSSLFKTTKAKKKSKKGKGKDKDLTQSNATDDVTNKDAAPTEEQPQTAAAPVASEISVTPPSDEVVPAEGAETMRDSVDEVPAEGGQNVTDEQGSEDAAHASDSKTDVSGADDTPAVLNTTESREITMTMGEGPQLTQSEGDVVETQPIKADGSLPPERAGREKESLLHDHNPEGMICCVIL